MAESGISLPGPRQVLTVVYDRVAAAPVGPVISTPSVGVAVRMFQDVAKDERSYIHAHPGDYDLLQIGYLEGTALIACDVQVVLNGGDVMPEAIQLPLQEVV